MIYLSKLELNPASRQVQSELRDPYQMHRTLCRAFGDGVIEQARPLFRVEEARNRLGVQVLVQSLIEPDWTRLPVDARYWQSPDKPVPMKAYQPVFTQGQRLAFRLKANPTVRKDGKRVGLYDEQGHERWLQRKGDLHGFRLLTLNQTPAVVLKSRMKSERTGQWVSVTFDGFLKVVDPVLFLGAVHNGIGSGKAFGFGLLSLARG